jgi:hypothetical protein
MSHSCLLTLSGVYWTVLKTIAVCGLFLYRSVRMCPQLCHWSLLLEQ